MRFNLKQDQDPTHHCSFIAKHLFRKMFNELTEIEKDVVWAKIEFNL